jgi:hypothetical protein
LYTLDLQQFFHDFPAPVASLLQVKIVVTCKHLRQF